MKDRFKNHISYQNNISFKELKHFPRSIASLAWVWQINFGRLHEMASGRKSHFLSVSDKGMKSFVTSNGQAIGAARNGVSILHDNHLKGDGNPTH
ncbi:hypothetical protein TNCV_935751 [Trichonephila clavipes]|nr:hypothetical protein TNCV_935751 [Trichonephila clavipes]